MRLLSPKEIEKKRREQEAVTVMRGAKIASLVDQQTKKFNLVKEAVTKQSNEFVDKYTNMVNAKLHELNNLESEVLDLEKRKTIALEPINDELNRLTQQKLQIDQARVDLEREQINFKAKVSDLSKREVDLVKSQIDLDALREEIEQQKVISDKNRLEAKEILSSAQKQANEIIETANKTKKDYEFKLEDVEKQRIAYNNRNKLLDDKEKLLSNDCKRLDSERAALKVAYDLAKEKGII